MTDNGGKQLQITGVDYGFVTKSDRNFYDGLIALLASLRTWHPGRPITVVDCGLTTEQASTVTRCPDVRLVGAPNDTFNIPSVMRHYYTPAIYGFFSVHDDLYPLTVHLDADAVVLQPLDELVRGTMESPVGISAVPDFPHLDLAYQMGQLDGAYDALSKVVEQPRLTSISFNGGVFALRAQYYHEHMKPWVNKLIPYHELFWGNDMAIMNFAAYAANRETPFNVVPHTLNTRAAYRRAPELPSNRIVGHEGNFPWLEGPFGTVKVLHFVGKSKPWTPAAPPDDSVRAWSFYRTLGANWFE